MYVVGFRKQRKQPLEPNTVRPLRMDRTGDYNWLTAETG